LSFLDKDWKDTKPIFIEVADTVILPHLKHLTINGLRCIGTDLQLFLHNHNSLQQLALENLDIERPGTFADVLEKTSGLQFLTSFRCRQIAQCGLRTAFRTLCYVEASDQRQNFDERAINEDTTWPAILVSQYKYTGVAEEWEGVSGKLRDLSRDVYVTSKSRHSDHEGGYYWDL
jgi:hypothetical protein